MTGYDASSSERRSGPLLLRVTLEPGPEGSIELVQRRIQVFLDALEAGFFFPGGRPFSAPVELQAVGRSVNVQLEVFDLPVAALFVLSGMLAACHHHAVRFQDAHVVMGSRNLDLLRDSRVRPKAEELPPFAVEFPRDLAGNSALLVEIEFAQPVPADVRQSLLGTLTLWDVLTLAYPLDPDDPVEVSGAQAMFNDPRTIHYHEWIWDNAHDCAWDLIVNLCCVWHERWPIVRLHFE